MPVAVGEGVCEAVGGAGIVPSLVGVAVAVRVLVAVADAEGLGLGVRDGVGEEVGASDSTSTCP